VVVFRLSATFMTGPAYLMRYTDRSSEVWWALTRATAHRQFESRAAGAATLPGPCVCQPARLLGGLLTHLQLFCRPQRTSGIPRRFGARFVISGCCSKLNQLPGRPLRVRANGETGDAV
jgi:hypothetical protein